MEDTVVILLRLEDKTSSCGSMFSSLKWENMYGPVSPNWMLLISIF
jgi:hypothetical protein